jgi:hypothetical protein
MRAGSIVTRAAQLSDLVLVEDDSDKYVGFLRVEAA